MLCDYIQHIYSVFMVIGIYNSPLKNRLSKQLTVDQDHSNSFFIQKCTGPLYMKSTLQGRAEIHKVKTATG